MISYARAVTIAAREVRIANLTGTGSVERNEKLGEWLMKAADQAGIHRRTAARDWVAEISSPAPYDQELAELKTKWDAIQPAEGTIGWYNKWFCENTMDHGLPYTIAYYKNCLAQYEEWMAEEWSGTEEELLAFMKEQYDEFLRDSCEKCYAYTEAARLAGVRIFPEDIPDTEHAKH